MTEPVHDQEIITHACPDCLLCGQPGEPLYEGLQDRQLGVPGEWRLLACHACGLAWLDPQPDAAEIPGLYAGYFTHWPRSPKALFRTPLVERSATALLLGYDDVPIPASDRWKARILRWIGPVRDHMLAGAMWLPGTRRGRLLDVGCGNGEFLARMRDLGWEVMGVEPDPAAVRVAQEHYGVEVTCGSIEHAGLPDNGFDAVTLSHVIEHLPDPIGTLRECARVLKPGGVLVATTPNTRSLGRHWLREAWVSWHVPRHLFIFDPRSIGPLAERAGLTVVEVLTSAHISRSCWTTSRALARQGSLGDQREFRPSRRLLGEALFFWLLEYTLSRFIPCGEELALIATKSA